MDGADKGLLPFLGRPLISHVIDAIRPQVETIIVSANRHREQYEHMGFPVVSDLGAGFAGPLAGVARVLEEAATPYVLIAPCDMPFLPHDMAKRLMEALIMNGAQAASVKGAGRAQPLCALLRRDVADDLRDYRLAGGANVRQWLFGLRHAVAEYPDSLAEFRNINTPEELLAAAP